MLKNPAIYVCTNDTPPPARPPPSWHIPPPSTDRDWLKLALARSRETKFLLSSLRDAQGDQYLPPEGVEGEEGMPDTGAVQVMRAWNPGAVSKTASIADTGKTAKTSPKIPPAPKVVGKKMNDTSDNANTNGTTSPNRSAGSGSPMMGGGARGRSRIRSTVPPLRIVPAVAAPPPLIDVHARLQGSLISISQSRLLEVTPSGGGEAGSFGGGGKAATGGGARPSSRQVEPSAVERLGGHYSPAAQGLFVDPNRGCVAWRQREAIHYADGGGGGGNNVRGDRCLSSPRGAHLSPWRGEDRSRPGVRTEVDRRVVSSAVSADVSGREEEGARLARLARLARRATSAPGTKRCSRRMFSDDNDRDRPGTTTTTTTATVERFAGVDDASSTNRVRGRGTGISDTNSVPGEGAYSPQTLSDSSQRAPPGTEIRQSSQGEEQVQQEEETKEGGNNNEWIEGKRSAAPWTTERRGVSDNISLEPSLSKMRIPLDGTEQASPRHPSPALHRGNDDHQSPTTPVAGERWRLPSDESPRVAAPGRSYVQETETGELGSESDDKEDIRYYSSSIIATTATARGADDAVAGGRDKRLVPGSERCGSLHAWWMTVL